MTGMQAESNAFIRAQDIYQSSLQSLEKRNTMLEKKIVLLEAQIAALKKEGNS